MPRKAAPRKAMSRIPSGFAEEGRPFEHDEIVDGIAAGRVKDLMIRGVLDAKQVYRVVPARTLQSAPGQSRAAQDVGSRRHRAAAARNGGGQKGVRRRRFRAQMLAIANPALKDQVPIELAATDAGARAVEAVLTRIAHGVYS